MPVTQRARTARLDSAYLRSRPLKAAPRRSSRLGWLTGIAIRIVVMTILPLLVSVRGAVELHSRGYSSLASIGGAALGALLLFGVGAASLSHRLTGRARFGSIVRWVALPVVCAWTAFSLLHLARTNAKDSDVRSTYTALHPVLRFAVATAILGDGDLVVTDMSRVPGDYRRMGLPVFDRTLHYRQRDGWVHAIDLRTIGRSEIRNAAVRLYFGSMGLRTVRHVGTADHLHVELDLVPSRD